MTAISDYFRTALLIDDRFEADYRTPERLDDEEAQGLSDEPGPGLVSPPEDDETPVRPSQIVNAFLAKGVLCSVLELKSDSDLVDLALRSVQIADLLILDWLMFDDYSATIDAIKSVVETNKDRLTVIVIFTGVPSLGGVVERLMDAVDFEKADDFVLKSHNTVVLVFGKPEITLTGGEDSRTADYSALPRMIRDDLEIVFKGLTPEFAFGGINVLRDSVPRVLATFNSELDAGVLTHRALLPEPSDVGSQLIRLLVSDFEQALSDARVGDIWNIDSLNASLAQATADGNPAELATKLRSAKTTPQIFKELEDDELARAAIADGLSKIGLDDKTVSRRVVDLTAVFGDIKSSNESLAVLMSSTSFGGTPPRLELGVVLRSESQQDENQQDENQPDENQQNESDAKTSYWLCIQPLCDSVRLAEARAFPLLPITHNGDNPEAMIRPPEGIPIRVAFDSSPHKLVMAQFAPTANRAVIAHGTPSNWYFTTVDSARYQAVARLRPEVAAQVAHRVATAASRAGVDPSEWLKRGGSS